MPSIEELKILIQERFDRYNLIRRHTGFFEPYQDFWDVQLQIRTIVFPIMVVIFEPLFCVLEIVENMLKIVRNTLDVIAFLVEFVVGLCLLDAPTIEAFFDSSIFDSRFFKHPFENIIFRVIYAVTVPLMACAVSVTAAVSFFTRLAGSDHPDHDDEHNDCEIHTPN